jgi:hypothetical protein
MADRYRADRYDADGRFYVFDTENAGQECAGPFDSQEEAIAEQDRRNDALAMLGVMRLLVDTAFGIFGVDEALDVSVTRRKETGETVVLLCEVTPGGLSPLAELVPPRFDYEDPPPSE